MNLMIKEQIKEMIKQAIGAVGIFYEGEINLEHPDEEKFGDYSSNIALKCQRSNFKSQNQMSKVKSVNPRELAQLIMNNFPNSELIEKIEVAGAGFINFFLNKKYLVEELKNILKAGKDYGKSKLLLGKKIAVEYTDPNPFKEFHLGHLYSNVIGESVALTLEALGAKVWRGDFYGDVGMHIAKSVWGIMRKMQEENKTIADLEKLTIVQRQAYLGQGYAMGVRKYEEDSLIQEEIKQINLLIYIAAQEILQKKKGWKPLIDYRRYLTGGEKKLAMVREVYSAGLQWSLDYFESIYKILGTKFDGYYPESWVGEYGMKIVEKGLKMGVLEKSEGVVVYKGEQDGLHTRVFVNKLGLPTYEAKDLGLAFAKYQDFKYDLSINVFGKEIDEYYKVVKAAMLKIEPELGKKAAYLAHGMVRLPEGKMSSRSGNVITFLELLEEAKKKIRQIMEEAKKQKENVYSLSEAEKNSSEAEKSKSESLSISSNSEEEILQKVALGAIKYALLKTDIGRDVIFDFKTSLSFEGDSGPYLMYTYARTRSVLRKSQVLKLKTQNQNLNLQTFNSLNLYDEEISLLRFLCFFPEVVREAGGKYAPSLICKYLFELAQKYNLFYNKLPILKADLEEVVNFRLMLNKAVGIVLKNGLKLLGIEVVERM